MLVLTRKPEETIQIGENIVLRVVKVKGNKVQLGIEAPKDIAVIRSELLEKVAPADVPESLPPSKSEKFQKAGAGSPSIQSNPKSVRIGESGLNLVIAS